MNPAQTRIVRFVATGAVAGLFMAFLIGPRGGVGLAEQAILMAIFGMMVGVVAAWFTGLK